MSSMTASFSLISASTAITALMSSRLTTLTLSLLLTSWR